jgi:hypothetical protein
MFFLVAGFLYYSFELKMVTKPKMFPVLSGPFTIFTTTSGPQKSKNSFFEDLGLDKSALRRFSD